MILGVKDIWHGKENEVFIWSNDRCFKDKEAFLNWVGQHTNKAEIEFIREVIKDD